jgi:hypothetical protein
MHYRSTRGGRKKLDGRELWRPTRLAFWERLKAGLPIEYETSRGFKSCLGAGDLRFTRVKVSRRLHFGIDKRCFEGNESRPWHTEELPELYNPLGGD